MASSSCVIRTVCKQGENRINLQVSIGLKGLKFNVKSWSLLFKQIWVNYSVLSDV